MTVVYVIEYDHGTKVGITENLEGRLEDFRRGYGAEPLLVAAFTVASRRDARAIELWTLVEHASDVTVSEWMHAHPLEVAATVAGYVRNVPRSPYLERCRRSFASIEGDDELEPGVAAARARARAMAPLPLPGVAR